MRARATTDSFLELARQHARLRERFAEFITVLLMSPLGMQLDGDLRNYVLEVARDEGLGIATE